MSTELFEKILFELEELDYAGKLSVFSNNEPFLDERIIDFHKYAREKVPKAFINLFTNGSLLNLKKLKDILPYVDSITIDNYNDEVHIPRKLRIRSKGTERYSA